MRLQRNDGSSLQSCFVRQAPWHIGKYNDGDVHLENAFAVSSLPDTKEIILRDIERICKRIEELENEIQR